MLEKSERPRKRRCSKLDSLDEQILALLRFDGRLPSAQIARELEVPEATVRYRLKRLKSMGLVVVLTMPAMDKVPARIRVVFFVRTIPGRAMALSDALKSLPCMRFLALGSGSYDLYVSTAFDSDDEYLDFRHGFLDDSHGVESFESMQLMKTVSRTYDYTLPDDVFPSHDIFPPVAIGEVSSGQGRAGG